MPDAHGLDKLEFLADIVAIYPDGYRMEAFYQMMEVLTKQGHGPLLNGYGGVCEECSPHFLEYAHTMSQLGFTLKEAVEAYEPPQFIGEL